MPAPHLLSVVVPVLNEERSLPALVDALEKVLPALAGAYEILLVDDGSSDGSLEVLRRLSAANERIRSFELRKNFGKSTALEVGFRKVRGDVVVTIDADLQDDPQEIAQLLAKLDEGYDLVVGWKVRREDRWSKRMASRIFNAVTALVSRLRIHDSNCGLKAFRKEVVQNLRMYGELHRYIPALAHWKGFKVCEIPVKHHPREYGRSKYGPERYLRGFFDLLTVAFISKFIGRPLHFFGVIGLTLIVPGLLICAYLLAVKITGGFIALRPLLTLGVLLLILGMVFLSTGLLAEMIVYLFRSRDSRLPEHVVRNTYGREP